MPKRRKPPAKRVTKRTAKGGLLGAHVSIAGGTREAPPRAKAIGATAMQIFTKMANRWAERACADDECMAFRAALAGTPVRATECERMAILK